MTRANEDKDGNDIILASQSPRRIELLRDAGLEISVRPADIDETPLHHEKPLDLVSRLARAKAQVCWLQTTDEDAGRVILAADTIVWLGDKVLGKPADEQDAKEMLHRLSGKVHHVSTGVCLMRNVTPSFKGARSEMLPGTSFVETTDVEFHRLTDADIDAYVASGEPMDKAGAYGIQGLGRMLVKRIDGDFYNVVGLPISRTIRELDVLLNGKHADVLTRASLEAENDGE